jgi:putative membrane protein insertion efficiency factor
LFTGVGKHRGRWLLAVAMALVAWDLARPPAVQWSSTAAIAAIHAYQRTLSPALGAAGVRCRFTPSCSRYAEVVIRKDGLVRGGWRAARRLVRCGPWTPADTVDEP